MSPVHYCPSCGLAFRHKTELEYHWSEEHDPAVQAAAVPAEEDEPIERRPEQ